MLFAMPSMLCCSEDGLNKILFISLSNIGDAVMTTPVLYELHLAWPGATIDIVAGQRSQPVFEHCPWRGEIFIKNKKAWLRGYPSLLLKLWRTRYDLVVDLRTDGFAWLLRAGQRRHKEPRRRQDRHAVEEHLSVITDLTELSPDPRTHLWLSDSNRAFAERTLDHGHWLAIGPGCGGPEKVWPGDRYGAVIDALSDRFNGVVLLGGSGDRDYARHVTDSSDTTILDLTGQTGILEAAAVMERCELFIGSDSGLGHLAGAVNTPTLTLFGVGQPHRYRPWQERAEWLAGDNEDMRNIHVDAVLDAARRLLA
jgi:ADP-heptose:LPS heptosyltransferase